MRTGILRSLAILGLLLFSLPATARAVGVPSPIEPELTEREHAQLKSRIEERWRVVPTREGLLLVPRQPSGVLKGVELSGTLLFIDGQPASGADLYRRLGSGADAVLELSYLTREERAELFPPQTQADTPVERARAPLTSRGSKDTSSNLSTQIVQGSRVRVGGSITVAEHEQVENAVAVFGSADVKGLVTGNLVTVGGDIRLGPKAVVRGDVMAVGGRVLTEDGALVSGATTELGSFGTSLQTLGLDDGTSLSVAVKPDWPRITRWTFYIGLVAFFFWFVLAAGLSTIAPSTVARMRTEMRESPIAAFLVGLMMQVLFLPVLLTVAALLAMSIIGIPLLPLIPLVFCLVVAGGVMGFAGIATAVGERLVGPRLPIVALAVGFVLIYGLGLLGRYMWMATPGMVGLGVAFGIVGLSIEYVAWTLGLGGAVLTWLAGRRSRSTAAVPAPTPMPPPLVDY